MSALTPHIRAMRAEAAELLNIGREAHESGNEEIEAGENESAHLELTAALLLTRLAQAKFAAADRLDAEEPKSPLEEPRRSAGPFTVGKCQVHTEEPGVYDGAAVFDSTGQPFCLIADDLAIGGRSGAMARATRIAENLNRTERTP